VERALALVYHAAVRVDEADGVCRNHTGDDGNPSPSRRIPIPWKHVGAQAVELGRREDDVHVGGGNAGI